MKKCHPLITVSSLISPRVEQSNECGCTRHSNGFKKRFALTFDNLTPGDLLQLILFSPEGSFPLHK